MKATKNEKVMALNDTTLARRFWAKVDIKGDNDCWNWTANLASNRYGAIRVGGKYGKMLKAHRVSLILSGIDTTGKLVLHHCDNPKCVNPKHLFLGSQTDNMLDMRQKGRGGWNAGSKNHNASLTKQQAISVVEMVKNGASTKDVAKYFKVGLSIIQKICSGMIYRQDLSGIELPDMSTNGEKHHNSKLTEKIVAALRVRYKELRDFNLVATEFNVDRNIARRAINGERWNYVVLGEPPIKDKPLKRSQLGSRKLTNEQAVFIFNSTANVSELSEKFNVSKVLIHKIRAKQAYQWIHND